jgi:hypothetical protein
MQRRADLKMRRERSRSKLKWIEIDCLLGFCSFAGDVGCHHQQRREKERKLSQTPHNIIILHTPTYLNQVTSFLTLSS